MRSFTLLFLPFLVVCIDYVLARGRLVEPPQRSSLWRYGYHVARNYDDNALNCGGFWRHQYLNHGRCGICGDPWDAIHQNEAGGKYARGVIPRRYSAEDEYISVAVEVTANIGGFFEFRLCPQTDVDVPVDNDCLDKNQLKVQGHGLRYDVTKKGLHELRVEIPEGMSCEHCVLQWKWRGANNWGICKNRRGRRGCGPQEEYYNCADIAIDGTFSTREVETEPLKPTVQPSSKMTTVSIVTTESAMTEVSGQTDSITSGITVTSPVTQATSSKTPSTLLFQDQNTTPWTGTFPSNIDFDIKLAESVGQAGTKDPIITSNQPQVTAAPANNGGTVTTYQDSSTITEIPTTKSPVTQSVGLETEISTKVTGTGQDELHLDTNIVTAGSTVAPPGATPSTSSSTTTVSGDNEKEVEKEVENEHENGESKSTTMTIPAIKSTFATTTKKAEVEESEFENESENTNDKVVSVNPSSTSLNIRNFSTSGTVQPETANMGTGNEGEQSENSSPDSTTPLVPGTTISVESTSSSATSSAHVLSSTPASDDDLEDGVTLSTNDDVDDEATIDNTTTSPVIAESTPETDTELDENETSANASSSGSNIKSTTPEPDESMEITTGTTATFGFDESNENSGTTQQSWVASTSNANSGIGFGESNENSGTTQQSWVTSTTDASSGIAESDQSGGLTTKPWVDIITRAEEMSTMGFDDFLLDYDLINALVQ